MLKLQPALQHIDNYARVWIDRQDMPGLALAITGRDALLWESSYGYSDLGPRAPLRSDTLFEIGSVGKPLTNIGLLQLRDEGILDLRAPVSRYLPWFEVQSQFPPITTHHLMSQTAAIVQGTDLAPHGLYEAWALRETKAGSAPGEVCSYSNVGYKTLGFLLERLTGQAFEEAIKSRVLTPLGMTQTHPVITHETRKKAATGYAYLYDDRPEHPSQRLVPAIWSEYGTGDGCQASTAADMAIYLRILLNRGKGPLGRIISEESFDLMTQRAVWTGNDYYGYGLATYPLEGRTLIGHGGGTAGFMSAVVVDMEAGLGAVALVNRAGEPEAPLQLVKYALSVVRAAQIGEPMPLHPAPTDPYAIPNATDYAGIYRSDDQLFRIEAQDGSLLLVHGGRTIPLEQRGQDAFYARHPDFELFLLEFKREQGKVVEACHGPDWFIGEMYDGPRRFDYPEEWNSYPGHYRARNPQLSNFRVVLRKGRLVLVFPTGGTETLEPLDKGEFRIGQDDRLPDTLRFGAVVDGHALRADYAGCPYFRTFTP